MFELLNMYDMYVRSEPVKKWLPPEDRYLKASGTEHIYRARFHQIYMSYTINYKIIVYKNTLT